MILWYNETNKGSHAQKTVRRLKKGLGFMKKIRTFTCILLAALALTGCAPAANGQSTEPTTAPADSAQTEDTTATEVPSETAAEPVKFNIGHLPATGHILYFIAYEEGYFAEEGLDVTLTQFSNNSEELAALESGKIDVAPINATNLINFIGDGHDLVSIGGVMSDGHALVVNPKLVEGLDPEDYTLDLLKDKTIILQKGSTYDIEFRIALKEAGFDLEKDVHIENTESGTTAYASLKNAEVDGAAVYAPFRQKAIDEGYVPLLYCDEIDYFDHPICCRNVAISSHVTEDPEVFEAFSRAMIKAGEFLENDHVGSVADAKKYLDVDTDLLESEIYNHSINNPDPDEQKTVTFYQAMQELGYVNHEFDITEHINNAIYENALNALLSENPDDAYLKDLETYHQNAVQK